MRNNNRKECFSTQKSEACNIDVKQNSIPHFKEELQAEIPINLVTELARI